MKSKIGTVTIRTRTDRNQTRAYVKVGQPNKWQLRARLVWEQHNGSIPQGYGIHHMDGDMLNDAIENLELVSKADHLARHRDEFRDRAVATWIRKRREQRWSTRSETKRTGRPPSWTDEQMEKALDDYFSGSGTAETIGRNHGINSTTLRKYIKVAKNEGRKRRPS